jgi:chaperonin GroEL (HSP60 family)
MQMFLEEENRMLKTMVDKLHDLGANVLICQKGIDDIAQHYLAKYGIMAVRRVKESDMIKLSKATGGRVISNFDDMSESDLGTADLAQQKKVESDKWVFIEGCKHPQSVTMLIRGGSQRVIDEVDRSIHDSLMVVKDVIEKPEIVAGGGAPEAYAASLLKDWADNFDGKEQLAIKKYAEALETIPLTIAENAGMDPIDTMANLRAKQNQGHKWTGIDARNMKIADMMAIHVVEPIVVKEQIVKSATEAACMILRIDDVIAVSGAPGGGMPGMG